MKNERLILISHLNAEFVFIKHRKLIQLGRSGGRQSELLANSEAEAPRYPARHRRLGSLLPVCLARLSLAETRRVRSQIVDRLRECLAPF